MGKAKAIELKPISPRIANQLVRKLHYSGKIVPNSQLHIGVFYHGRLEGALQFGPSLDKRKMIGLVEGTEWNEFMELNRLAFSDRLPRNSESRALAISIRLIRKFAKHVKWVLSFADASQSGDGAIYRAAGFDLIGIKENHSLYQMPDGQVIHEFNLRVVQSAHFSDVMQESKGGASLKAWTEKTGAKPLPGYQLKYIYFLAPACREQLTVPIIPYSEIGRRGIGMYRGEHIERAGA